MGRVMSAAAMAIIAGVVLIVMSIVLVGRGARRIGSVNHLKGAAVSKQWLIEHGGDDRS
jgi:hypothetical protein